MATTPTKDPIPSEKPVNLKFNAGKLDEEVNSDALTYTDRFDVDRLTNAGRNVAFSASQADRESRFQEFLNSSGYVFLGDYELGPWQFSERNQYIRYDNQYWRLAPSAPTNFATTGITMASFEVDKLSLVVMDGDTLRQEMASPSGASMSHLSQGGSLQTAVNWVTPKMRGAVGDGDADDTLAIASWWDYGVANGLELRGDGPGVVYKVSAALIRVLATSRININMCGSRFYQAGNNQVFNVRADGQTVKVASVTEVSYNLGNGTANTRVMQVVCETPHPFSEVGVQGKVYSNDIVPDTSAANQFRGEYFMVGAIESDLIFYTDGVFIETYTTGIGVALPAKVEINAIGLNAYSVWDDSFKSAAFNFAGISNLNIIAPVGEDINTQFLNITSCPNYRITDANGFRIKNRPDLAAYGYFINDSAGWFGNVSNMYCEYARHAYTTTTPTSSAADDDKWWLKGRTIGSVVRDSTTLGCANGFDTHSEGYMISFINCEPIDDYRGNDTGGAGIQVRGDRCKVINPKTLKSKIGVAYSGALRTQKGYFEVSGLNYDGPVGHTPLILNGSASFKNTVRVTDISVFTMAGYAIDNTYCDLKLSNPAFRMSPAGNGAAVIALRDGAKVRWIGGEVEWLTGNSHSLVDHLATDTSAFVKDVEVNGVSGRLSYFSRSVSQYEPSSLFKGLTLDAALPGIPFLGFNATSPKFSGDYTVDYNGNPTGLRVFTWPLSDTPEVYDYGVNLQLTSEPVVEIRVQTTGTTPIRLISLTQGARAGQLVSINNRNTSTQTLQIINSSTGLLLLGTSITLAAGEGTMLIWDGSNWRKS